MAARISEVAGGRNAAACEHCGRADTADAMAFPIAEGFRRLGVESTKGYALIKAGELETFTIGRFRYVTLAEIRRFIAARIEASKAEDKAAKVQAVTEASLASRRAGGKRRDLGSAKGEGRGNSMNRKVAA